MRLFLAAIVIFFGVNFGLAAINGITELLKYAKLQKLCKIDDTYAKVMHHVLYEWSELVELDKRMLNN